MTLVDTEASSSDSGYLPDDSVNMDVSFLLGLVAELATEVCGVGLWMR